MRLLILTNLGFFTSSRLGENDPLSKILRQLTPGYETLESVVLHKFFKNYQNSSQCHKKIFLMTSSYFKTFIEVKYFL